MLVLSTYFILSVFLVGTQADPQSFDCLMREQALAYAQEINPYLTQTQLQDICDALDGSSAYQTCNLSIPTDYIGKEKENYTRNDLPHRTIYVSINDGIDTISNNYGHSIDKPFATIEFGLNYISQKFDKNILKQLIIREGTYFIGKRIELTPLHSNLIITNYNNEIVNITGSLSISKCQWNELSESMYFPNQLNTKNQSQNKSAIYYCQLTNNNNNSVVNNTVFHNKVYGLRLNGYRQIRARYPNANPEIDGFGSTIVPISNQRSQGNSDYYIQESKIYTDASLGMKPIENAYWHVGIGGYCNEFIPPISYFCSETGWGIPYSITYDNNILPNSIYYNKNNISNTVIQMWQKARWETWAFEIDTNKSNVNNNELYFKYGGFQGSRGGYAGQFYIENMFVEMDFEAEWYYNDTNGILYYFTNKTGNPNDYGNDKFEIVVNKQLLYFHGSNSSYTVENVVISGLNFINTAYTYLDPHGVPSGGDWALQLNNGAITLLNCKDFIIHNNLFSRIDGIALYLYKYNYNITITQNEFAWIGDSNIALWGSTNGITYNIDKVNTLLNNSNSNDYFQLTSDDIPSFGSDGYTTNDQPRNIIVRLNFAHELGIWEKQSSFYFQAKSCENIIENNIFFNGPRAGILFNDGFGGGSLVKRNLMFNTCKESTDHGPFNSWDRQPYNTNINNKNEISAIKKYDQIDRNFFIANYGATWAVDFDDTSRYYNVTNNVLIYGQMGLKTNFAGHNNYFYNNLVGYVSKACVNMYDTDPIGFEYKDRFINNTCVLNQTVDGSNNNGYFDYSSVYNCSNIGIILANNSIMINNGNNNNVGICNHTQNELNNQLHWDYDSNVYSWPPDEYLVQLIRDLLF